MPIVDDFTGRPQAAPEETENAVERDLLAMPNLPWRAATFTLFAVVLGFCIAHAILLATKEKNKLITQTLAQRDAELEYGETGPIISGDDVVQIPAGPFTMGRPEDDPETNSDATPEHVVNLPSYYIGKYEVTNAQYREFVKATNHIPPPSWHADGTYDEGMDNLPVTYVNWEQAKAYAAWKGGRLCTEEEWEKAARGTDKRLYPYGNDYDPANANVNYLVDHLTPVGSYPGGASPYGVMDMMGNLYEWTADHYAPYPGNQDDPVDYAAFKTDETGNVMIDPDKESFYVVTRGGCWKCDPWSSQVTTRNPTRPDYGSDFFGVRVCWDDPAAAKAKR